MDIKSWILLVGTLLIVAVICHGFWTAYRVRRNEVRMDIEKDLPEGDLDDMVLLREELPNGGARVTPTFGYDALRIKKSKPFDTDQADGPLGASAGLVSSNPLDGPVDGLADPLEEALIALDDAVASAGEGLRSDAVADEGDIDAGYQPEQATLDLEMEALEERFAARVASEESAPLLTDAQVNAALPTAELPPKKQITPERAAVVPRKQFEPPLPEEIEAQRIAEAEQARQEQAARARAERERAELEALAQRQQEQERERQAQHEAKVEAQRVRRLEQEQREAQARIDAQNREAAKAQAKAEAQAKAQAKAKARREAEARQPEQLSLAAEPLVEFPEAKSSQPKGGQDATRHSGSTAQLPAEELVVLNVVAKTRAFHGGDVLELFLRNGIKFGDMNIFHRMDPVSKASQYSIASVTEPGYFDLHAMAEQEFRGLCLFMQLPCSSQATKVFTDMLTVADKLARQLDGEVCDEQFNRLTRQSTEHYRQRVAEFTRRNMSRRA